LFSFFFTPSAQTMENSPPPLFRQGPSAFARLVFFVVLSLALLIADVRFQALNIAREVLAAGLYPLQRIALVPRDLFMGATSQAQDNASLRSDNAQLRAQDLQLSQNANRVATLSAENAHLRALLQLAPQVGAQAVPAEIQYDARDPFTQKIIINRGSSQGISNGSPVVTEDGLLGQVTHVYPWQAEVSLITDKDHAVPVEIVRTGLRSVAYGTLGGYQLDLRFVPVSADVVAGDELVTSGLDGVYPQGLPVAKVVRIDKQSDTEFMRIACVPLAIARSARQMLVLHYAQPRPARPDDDDAAASGASAASAARGSAAHRSHAHAPHATQGARA
jgi:rod shape-determining protein MreC